MALLGLQKPSRDEKSKQYALDMDPKVFKTALREWVLLLVYIMMPVSWCRNRLAPLITKENCSDPW